MLVQSTMLQISGLYRVPVIVPVSFVTNGGSAPTVFGGHVETVERKVTAAPAPFFRIRFLEQIPNLTAAKTVITYGVEAPVGTSAVVVFSRTGYTANPADPLEVGRELDVQLLESGTAVDTAGRAISLSILIDAGAAS